MRHWFCSALVSQKLLFMQNLGGSSIVFIPWITVIRQLNQVFLQFIKSVFQLHYNRLIYLIEVQA